MFWQGPRSVISLEFEYGLLQEDAEERRHSLIFLRGFCDFPVSCGLCCAPTGRKLSTTTIGKRILADSHLHRSCSS